MPNFTEIEETFVDGRTDGRTYVHTDGRTSETHFIRSTQKSRPKILFAVQTAEIANRNRSIRPRMKPHPRSFRRPSSFDDFGVEAID